MVPDAYSDLCAKTATCGVEPCKCPKGRSYTDATGRWELIICNICGELATHKACHKSLNSTRTKNPEYHCERCEELDSSGKQILIFSLSH